LIDRIADLVTARSLLAASAIGAEKADVARSAGSAAAVVAALFAGAARRAAGSVDAFAGAGAIAGTIGAALAGIALSVAAKGLCHAAAELAALAGSARAAMQRLIATVGHRSAFDLCAAAHGRHALGGVTGIGLARVGNHNDVGGIGSAVSAAFERIARASGQRDRCPKQNKKKLKAPHRPP
jgi:hypothetical protein